VQTVWLLTDHRYLRQRMPAALGERLAARGIDVRTILADDAVAELSAGAATPPWRGLRPDDLVLARTRNRFGLALLRAAERHARVLTPWEPVAAVRNKPRAVEELACHGVPLPRTWAADRPEALRALPRDRFPLLLKPHLGDNGRGIVAVASPEELDELEWGDGFALAQELVPCAPVDLKLYVAGEHVWGVRRPSPLAAVASTPPERVELDGELRRLAVVCGEAFDLLLYGVDVVDGGDGPRVVDVNEFPNYTGIEEAPDAIADLLVAALEREAVA